VALSPLSSPQSDSSPTRGSLKGNIKVKLLLGRRYKLHPTPKERRHSETSPGKAVKNDVAVSHSAAVVKEKRKRQRLSSGQSDDSVVSSSGESDVKYSLPVDRVTTTRRRGRPPLHPAALLRARARQLVSKARGGVQVDKKPAVSTTVRPWAPCWHGRLQLPTQSSRSSRKITINRRFLDDSYTSIGQLGLSQQIHAEQTTGQPATQDRVRASTKHIAADATSSAGSRVRAVGLLNRPLVSRPVVKQWKHLQTPNKTARPRVRQAKSLSESHRALETKDIDAADEDQSKTSDKQTVESEDANNLRDLGAPWLLNAHKSPFSYQSKKGSMHGQHCRICDNAYLVHHHYMCRVPCCRACARFYKTQCERGTQLDQLTCAEQGK